MSECGRFVGDWQRVVQPSSPECAHCGETLGDDPRAELGKADHDNVLVHAEPCATVMMRDDGWEIA